MATPFAPGSISLRLYPHLDLPAPAIIDELRAQAALAAECGFDGVMTSEHHGGFGGYLPNPLQAAGFALDAMPRGWAAPCPLLVLLRPVALVAEEIAWLAARFPGRVGIGIAAGALPFDFEVMETDAHDLAPRFEAALADLVRYVRRGDPGGALAGDPAIARCATHPVPVLSAAASTTAARRAARHGAGLVLDSLSTPERARTLIDAHRDAGGTGPCVLVRRAWVGSPFAAVVARQVETYRTYAPAGAQQHWGSDELDVAPDPAAVAERLVNVLERTGADALNLRVHAAGIPPAAVREQIVRLGTEVVGALR